MNDETATPEQDFLFRMLPGYFLIWFGILFFVCSIIGLSLVLLHHVQVGSVSMPLLTGIPLMLVGTGLWIRSGLMILRKQWYAATVATIAGYVFAAVGGYLTVELGLPPGSF